MTTTRDNCLGDLVQGLADTIPSQNRKIIEESISLIESYLNEHEITQELEFIYLSVRIRFYIQFDGHTEEEVFKFVNRMNVLWDSYYFEKMNKILSVPQVNKNIQPEFKDALTSVSYIKTILSQLYDKYENAQHKHKTLESLYEKIYTMCFLGWKNISERIKSECNSLKRLMDAKEYYGIVGAWNNMLVTYKYLIKDYYDLGHEVVAEIPFVELYTIGYLCVTYARSKIGVAEEECDKFNKESQDVLFPEKNKHFYYSAGCTSVILGLHYANINKLKSAISFFQELDKKDGNYYLFSQKEIICIHFIYVQIVLQGSHCSQIKMPADDYIDITTSLINLKTMKEKIDYFLDYLLKKEFEKRSYSYCMQMCEIINKAVTDLNALPLLYKEENAYLQKKLQSYRDAAPLGLNDLTQDEFLNQFEKIVNDSNKAIKLRGHDKTLFVYTDLDIYCNAFIDKYMQEIIQSDILSGKNKNIDGFYKKIIFHCDKLTKQETQNTQNRSNDYSQRMHRLHYITALSYMGLREFGSAVTLLSSKINITVTESSKWLALDLYSFIKHIVCDREYRGGDAVEIIEKILLHLGSIMKGDLTTEDSVEIQDIIVNTWGCYLFLMMADFDKQYFYKIYLGLAHPQGTLTQKVSGLVNIYLDEIKKYPVYMTYVGLKNCVSSVHRFILKLHEQIECDQVDETTISALHRFETDVLKNNIQSIKESLTMIECFDPAAYQYAVFLCNEYIKLCANDHLGSHETYGAYRDLAIFHLAAANDEDACKAMDAAKNSITKELKQDQMLNYKLELYQLRARIQKNKITGLMIIFKSGDHTHITEIKKLCTGMIDEYEALSSFYEHGDTISTLKDAASFKHFAEQSLSQLTAIQEQTKIAATIKNTLTFCTSTMISLKKSDTLMQTTIRDAEKLHGTITQKLPSLPVDSTGYAALTAALARLHTKKEAAQEASGIMEKAIAGIKEKIDDLELIGQQGNLINTDKIDSVKAFCKDIQVNKKITNTHLTTLKKQLTDAANAANAALSACKNMTAQPKKPVSLQTAENNQRKQEKIKQQQENERLSIEASKANDTINFIFFGISRCPEEVLNELYALHHGINKPGITFGLKGSYVTRVLLCVLYEDREKAAVLAKKYPVNDIDFFISFNKAKRIRQYVQNGQDVPPPLLKAYHEEREAVLLYLKNAGFGMDKEIPNRYTNFSRDIIPEKNAFRLEGTVEDAAYYTNESLAARGFARLYESVSPPKDMVSVYLGKDHLKKDRFMGVKRTPGFEYSCQFGIPLIRPYEMGYQTGNQAGYLSYHRRLIKEKKKWTTAGIKPLAAQKPCPTGFISYEQACCNMRKNFEKELKAKNYFSCHLDIMEFVKEENFKGDARKCILAFFEALINHINPTIPNTDVIKLSNLTYKDFVQHFNQPNALSLFQMMSNAEQEKIITGMARTVIAAYLKETNEKKSEKPGALYGTNQKAVMFQHAKGAQPGGQGPRQAFRQKK